MLLRDWIAIVFAQVVTVVLFFGLLVLFAILTFIAPGMARGGNPDPHARAKAALAVATASQAPRPPQAPTKPYCLCWHAGETCSCGVCTCPGGYDRGYARSVREGKPFVAYVGTPGQAVPGCVCVSVESLDGVEGPCCIVGEPGVSGNVYQRARLSCHATPADVKAVLRSPLATPVTTTPPIRFDMAPVRFSAPSAGGRGRSGC